MYDDCKQSLQRSIELLFDGNSKICQQKFTQYLEEKVAQRTEDTDNALKKFFKAILQKLSEENNEVYNASNLQSVVLI